MRGCSTKGIRLEGDACMLTRTSGRGYNGLFSHCEASRGSVVVFVDAGVSTEAR